MWFPKMQVVPYWSRGDVSVERKNPKGEVTDLQGSTLDSRTWPIG